MLGGEETINGDVHGCRRMSLRCRSQVRGDSVILSLTGTLDGAGLLEEAVGGLLRRSHRPLVIDLGGLWGWTDAGQRALATAAGRPASSGDVVLCAVPGHLRITDRQLSGLPRHHTLASALSALRGRARHTTQPAQEPAEVLRSGTPLEPGTTPLCHAACTLAAESRSVGRARHWAQHTLTEWGLPAAASRAALPLSEVVTNALLYGRAAHLQVSIDLWQSGDGRRLVVVGVQDHSPHPPMMSGLRPDDARPGGWGLHLLSAVSDTCGWYPRTDGPGKTVWFTCTPTRPISSNTGTSTVRTEGASPMRSATTSGSYAEPPRQAAYIALMRERERGRRPGSVLVYASATRDQQVTPDWPRTLAWATSALPAGVVVDTFIDAFPGGPDQYRARWRDYAADLDGLLLFGSRVAGRTYLLGPDSRAELRTAVGARLPVLLCTPSCGLVPVVDCRADLITGRSDQHHQSLLLTIPDTWSRSAPTLRAALDALAPAAHLRSAGDGTLLGMNRRA